MLCLRICSHKIRRYNTSQNQNHKKRSQTKHQLNCTLTTCILITLKKVETEVLKFKEIA